MPKTILQKIAFTLIMVFCMTVYTIAISENGLRYSTFLIAIREMWIEYVIVFVLIFFVVTKLAQKLAFRVFNPSEDKPILITIAIQSFTVSLIVPIITFFATFLHNGFTHKWFLRWLTTTVLCFPMAYCLQIFFVGPFVRWLFRKIFAVQQ